jgi:hypothetical protein
MRRALPLLGPEARTQVERMISPESLGTVAAVLALWVGSHFIGLGEVVDIVLLVGGVAALGVAVFDGVEELFEFASLSLGAQSEADLEKFAQHFARAVGILGVQAVSGILFRGAPKTWSGGRINVGAPPKFVRGAFSEPRGRWRLEKEGPASGVRSSSPDWAPQPIGAWRRCMRAFTALLTPKVNILRNFRVSGRAASYKRSALSKYLEEALAETVAQVGVNGWQSVFTGISFPVKNGYVTLLRRASAGQRTLYPVLPELAGLLAGGFILGGEACDIRFSTMQPPANLEAN